jgi:hypothetical protein
MRELGVRHLIASCLSCRHAALIDESPYPADMEVPWFGGHAVCNKCGRKRVDVRPNWKERPGMPTSCASTSALRGQQKGRSE